MNPTFRQAIPLVVVCLAAFTAEVTFAVPVVLQNGTATFSQLINGGPYSPRSSDRRRFQ